MRRKWHREADFAETGALGLYVGKGRVGRVWYGPDPQPTNPHVWRWLAEVAGKRQGFDYQAQARAWVEQTTGG